MLIASIFHEIIIVTIARCFIQMRLSIYGKAQHDTKTLQLTTCDVNQWTNLILTIEIFLNALKILFGRIIAEETKIKEHKYLLQAIS